MNWKTFILLLFLILFAGWISLTIDNKVNVNPMVYVAYPYYSLLNIIVILIAAGIFLVIIYKIFKL